MIVELQATMPCLSNTTENFVPTIIEELKNLLMLLNDGYMEPVHNEDIVFLNSTLSPHDVLLQMVTKELFVRKWIR
jgi:hypothetical protein